MPLSDVEIRVLGSLIEKERTTPDAYPLSSQALLAACNQNTARDPVMRLHLRDVEDAVVRLRERGLAATVRGSGERVPKHRQRLQERLDLSATEASLLALLLLRGPQTAAELRTRSERYVAIPDVARVEAVLTRLAERSTPLTRNVGRRPGQSQDRWMHTLAGDEERLQPRARRTGDGEAGGAPEHAAPEHASPGTGASERPSNESAATANDAAFAPPVAALLDRITRLEARVARLEADVEGRDGDD
ncbi:MAG: DUF480 domain-containing protein [Trueperaceae bacterium]